MRVWLEKVSDKRDFMKMAGQHFRELNPAFTPDPDWESSYFEKIQGNSDYCLHWILADGKRAGFVLYGTEPHRFLPRKTGAIYELYVAPEFRRKGVAPACAELVIQELWKASPSKIQLEVVEGNTAAAKLWARFGFAKVSQRLTLSPGPH